MAAKSMAINNASKTWIGEWERQLWQNNATLEVTGIKGDSITFSLQALSGSHTGEVEGVAMVKDHVAIYSIKEEGETCMLTFKLLGDSVISITQEKGNCFAGAGVTFLGDYKNVRLLKQTEKSMTMVDLCIFKDEREDSVFKALVGNDYSLFVNSTQLASEDEDLDGLHAKVQSAAVRGLFTIMENIIMTDSLNNIWAAVIDDGKVNYYTNNQDYKNQLPKTIDNWRENFKDYKVIYK